MVLSRSREFRRPQLAAQNAAAEAAVLRCDRRSWSGHEERERVVCEHLPQVRLIAAALHRRLPNHVAFEDLVQAGTIGLMDALRRFDADKGTRFRSYAHIRIRGAMLDSLRENDWAPRRLRRDKRVLTDTEARLSHAQGSYPDQLEIAREMGISASRFHKLVRDVDVANLRPMATEAAAAGERRSPLEEMLWNELLERVRVALQNLSCRERQILTRYYFEEMKMRDIGKSLGIAESRVSQIHASALRKVREAMTNAPTTT